MNARTAGKSISTGRSSVIFFRCCAAVKARNWERTLAYAATVCGEALRFRRRNSRKDRSASFPEPFLESGQRACEGRGFAVSFLARLPPEGGSHSGRAAGSHSERTG